MNQEVNLFEVLDPVEDFTSTGRARGQGRKGKVVEDEVRRQLEADGDVPYQVARARKEQWEARLKELDYMSRLGQMVDRAQVKEVCATAMADFVQTCRSVGDMLERRHGIDPEVCEVVNNVMDEALEALAEKFKMFGGE